jgi:hypothetical protein
MISNSSTFVYLWTARDINFRGEILCEASIAGSQKVLVLSPVRRGPGDIVPNCRTDMDDLLLLIREWGPHDSVADINEDGVVDVQDLMILLNDWTVS